MLLRRVADWWDRIGTKTEPIAAADWAAAYRLSPLLRDLSGREKRRLESLAAKFIADKVFEGAQGLEITRPMRLVIALQACLPILELGLDWYDGCKAIIVYPSGFVPERVYIDEFGVEHRVREELVGEAWERGPVILSWEDAVSAGPGDGHNPVIHEFAHKLDMRNGEDNGYPPLHADLDQDAWTSAFSSAYADFADRCERGEDIGIDEYAATSPGEFFAVISEVFFERPDLLQRRYPGVYAQLVGFYRQDPLARLVRHGLRH